MTNRNTFRYKSVHFIEPIHIRFGGDERIIHSIIDNIKQFADLPTALSIGESFYLGFWPVKIMREDIGLVLKEYSYEKGGYVEDVYNSAVLFFEQKSVIQLEGLTWHSLRLKSRIAVTPYVLSWLMTSVIEGCRYTPTYEEDPGWFLYTHLGLVTLLFRPFVSLCRMFFPIISFHFLLEIDWRQIPDC